MNEQVPSRFTASASFGLRTFPVRAKEKRPAVNWSEYRDREPTPDELAAWDASSHNVGIVCGPASGIAVVDVDSPEAQALLDGFDLPLTPRVRTARGHHYYFKYPDVDLRNSTKVAGEKLDIRGDGGYVVGAGSVHENGHQYEWVFSPADVDFAPFPSEILSLLTPDKATSEASEPTKRAVAGHRDRIWRWLDYASLAAKTDLESAAQGKRNDTLFRVAVSLAGDFVGAGGRAKDWPDFSEQLRQTALDIGLDAQEVTSTLGSAWRRGSSDPTRWMQIAEEWVYLAKQDVFYHLESGEHLKVNAFDKRFGSCRPNPKMTMSRFLTGGEFVKMVHELDYQPLVPDRYFKRGGLEWLNTYKPSTVTPVEGDAGPFADFIEYLVPDQGERQHLLRMMAWTVRNPGKKLRHALLLRSRHQGVGKSMLAEIWGELLGKHNVRKTTTEEVSSAYQGFIKQTLLVILEELNWGVGPVGYNRMKDLITADVAVVNEKYLAVRHWPNYATFIILTNLPVPILIEDTDRRIFYIDSPAVPRDKQYYVDFTQWWRENLGVIRGYLDTVDLVGFVPDAHPPMTAAKQALIADGRPDLVKDVALAIDEWDGVFARDIVTLEQVEAQLRNTARGKSRSQLVTTLKAIGATPFSQQRVPGKWNGEYFHPDPDRKSLWAIRNAEYWSVAGAQERGEEYGRKEGLFAPFRHLRLHIRHVREWVDAGLNPPQSKKEDVADQP